MISLNSTIEQLVDYLEKSSPAWILFNFNQLRNEHLNKNRLQTVKDFLSFELETNDENTVKLFSIVREEILKLVKVEAPENLPEPLIIKCAPTPEDFLKPSYNPTLVSFDSNNILDNRNMIHRDTHKVLVLSGESGAGKSFSSVRMLPRMLMNDDDRGPNIKTIVFYCCRDE